MKLNAGYPYWLIKHGLPFDYPKLEKSEKTDVLIIGGGISGALAAYHLNESGVDCLVVDARTIGLGSTCASTSLLQYEIDTPLCKLRELVGREYAHRAYQLCAAAITELYRIANKINFSDFRFTRSLYFAALKKDINFLKSEFDARKQAGFKVNYLDESDILSTFGFESPAGILSECGAQVNGYMFTHALLQYCLKKGVKVFDRSKIVRIEKAKRKITAVLKNGQIIKTAKVVNATGYEVVNFLDKNIVRLHSTYATISEQDPGHLHKHKDLIMWNTATPYLYLRTTADGRILVGGRDEKFFDPVKRDKLIKIKTKMLTKDYNKLFPDKPFKAEFSWAGTFGSTKDGLPYIGPYRNISHTYFSLGFGGNGITFSQVAARINTQLIHGKKSPDAAIFSFDRV